jgi:ribonuclease HI
MRAVVKGAVEDVNVRILLDTGANVSVLSTRLARRLGLLKHVRKDHTLNIQGISDKKVSVEGQLEVKITLGMNNVYVYTVWISDHQDTSELILGVDFLMSAGIRLDLYAGRALLPDEICISLNNVADTSENRSASRIMVSPANTMLVGVGETKCFRIQVPKELDQHELWVTRKPKWIPTIIKTKTGVPRYIKVTNVSEKEVDLQIIRAREPVGIWVEKDHIPLNPGYVRENSRKYKEWQVLAFEGTTSRLFQQRIDDAFDEWVAENPPLPNKPPPPTTPITSILKRETPDVPTSNLPTSSTSTRVVDSSICTRGAMFEEIQPMVVESIQAEASNGVTPRSTQPKVVGPSGARSKGMQISTQSMVVEPKDVAIPTQVSEDRIQPMEAEPMEEEELRVCKISVIEQEEADKFICMSAEQIREIIEKDQDKRYRHEAAQLHAESLAGQLAMLPEIADLQPEPVDIEDAKIGDGALNDDQVQKVKQILSKHQSHLIGGGNALPKPAKGVVCDIDVGDHPPISLPARRVKPEILVKLFDLLKALLTAGLIKMSRSAWGSPIVIVYKKDGETIRLCIDYRAVNSITKAMAYPMALVDDLLESFDEVLWFCSLDAASGFWAVSMTQRASDISAFVCPLGHFQWTRMPFGLKNAPALYQRMLDNGIWGFVKPKNGWEHKGTEPIELNNKGRQLDMFDDGTAEDTPALPIMWRRSFVDDVAFGAKTFDECISILDCLLTRFVQLGICVSFLKSLFCMPKVDFLSHLLSNKGLEIKPKAVAELNAYPFPSSKREVQSFLGSLNYYSKFIQDFGVLAATLYEIQDEDFSDEGKLGRARRSFDLLKARAVAAPVLRYFKHGEPVYIMLFANHWAISATVMQLHDGKYHPVRFVSRVLKQNELGYHIAEKEVLALLRALKVCYTMLAGQELTILTRFSTLKWLYTHRALYGRPLQFAVMLSPWTFTVERIDPSACTYTALLTSSIVPIEELQQTLLEIEPTLRGKTKSGGKVDLPYPLLPKDYEGYLLSFDGSIKKPTVGGYGSCGYVIWKLPKWEVAYAACDHIAEATINTAEYGGLLRGLRQAVKMGILELFVTGDSQIVLTQVTGRKMCHQAHLQILLDEVKDLSAKFDRIAYLHLVRKYNGAADLLATEALKTKEGRVANDESTKVMLQKLNKLPEAVYIPPEPDGTANTRAEEATDQKVVCAAIDHPDLDSDEDEAEEKIEVLELAHLERLLTEVYADVQLSTAIGSLLERCYPTTNHISVLTRSGSNAGLDSSTENNEQTAIGETPDPTNDMAGEMPSGVLPQFEPVHFPSYTTPEAVQDERFRRLAHAQDEEKQWLTLKRYLNGELQYLTVDEVKKCEKIAEFFVLDSLGVLRYVGDQKKRSQHPDRAPRLVVPTTIQQEVMYLAHASLEGGHQGVVRTYYKLAHEYYWPAMYAMIEQYVLACTDCSTGKGKPIYRGSSPGNVTATRPMQVVSMDAAGPFPRSARGNRHLLLFQCSFTGYVMCKPLVSLDSLSVAQAYEECVFRRFGASEVLRHDRAPEFMSEAFELFNKMIGQRQRATLSYRPQANGQQERSVQTVIKTVKQFASDPAQRDWDEFAEKLMFALNVSFDFTRKETPFYLIHGWDAKSTLSSMLPAVSQRVRVDKDSAEWRRRFREQHQLALRQAYDLQVAWKKKRADLHNARLRRPKKKRSHPTPSDDPFGPTPDTSLYQSTTASEVEYKPGDAVWMYVARVKEGLTKKLAHLWHGPFRIKRKIDQHCYELELPAREGYRFYPVVHVARLKPRALTPDRPSTELSEPTLPRLDFDEELLPEDSFEPSSEADVWEVDALLDDRTQRDRKFSRIKRQFLVRWKGNYDPSWTDESNLSCPALIHDYWERKKATHRFQQVQLADESR